MMMKFENLSCTFCRVALLDLWSAAAPGGAGLVCGTIVAQFRAFGSSSLSQIRSERGRQARPLGENTGRRGREGAAGDILARTTHRWQPRRRGHGHAQALASCCASVAVHR